MQTFLYVLHFLVCLILIGVVLLQRGKGQDLGASLGGGSANTIFGSRGAGNFLTRITTGSAIVFMITSLSLSYLGYKSSDVRLFDESEPFVPEGVVAPAADDSGLEEVPAATGSTAAPDAAAGAADGALVEIPSAASEAEAEKAVAPAAEGVAESAAGADKADTPTAEVPESDSSAQEAPSAESAPAQPEKPANQL